MKFPRETVDWEMQVVGTLGAPAFSDGVREEEPDRRRQKSCRKEGSRRAASEWEGHLHPKSEVLVRLGTRDQNGAPGHRRSRQCSAEGSGHLCVCPEEEWREHLEVALPGPRALHPRQTFVFTLTLSNLLINTENNIPNSM